MKYSPKTKSFFLLIIALTIFNHNALAFSVDTLKYGNFGKVTIYKPTTIPNSVVLFVSGDGGWNVNVVEMAQRLVQQGALVAGIDIKYYFKRLNAMTSKCCYPAADFEDMSLMLQKKYKLPQYNKPILVGYSSGATLVYGILAQAPADTFKGAISLGFCPDIEMSKPLCSGSGLKQHVLKPGKSFYLEPSDKLTAPFIALNGTKDMLCDFTSTSQFIEEVNTGKMIELPKVGHGFAVASNWIPQFKEAYQQVLEAPSFAEQKTAENVLLKSQNLEPLSDDFPVILLPTALKDDSKPMVFLISGDGGWTSFDHSIAETLAQKGMPVVGLDAQKYFWNKKTPGQTALEVEKAVLHYLKQWNKDNFILVGYSFGANVVPFIANKLSRNLKSRLTGIYCLSPNEKADFEIHLSDMLGIGGSAESYKVINEIEAGKEFKTVCIFGNDEDNRLRSKFEEAGAKVNTVPGNHHYNNHPDAAATVIVKDVENEAGK